MSIGAPSNLGTLLVQRLDAALGITLGQQANISSGAGPQAVPQPNNPENPGALQNPAHRSTRESVDQANAEGQRRALIGSKATREMQLDNLLGRSTTFQGTTQSAPTTLGYAARIILALLNHYPQGGQPIQGRTPLLPSPSGGQQPGPATSTGGGQAQTAPTSSPSGPGNTSAAAPGGQTQTAPTSPVPRGTLIMPAAGQAQTAPASSTPRSIPAAGPNQVWAQMASNLNQPGALAAQFSQALSQSIQGSGLFYESHLAQLAAGKTTSHALRQEPQGQIPPQNPQAAPSNQQTLPQARIPASLSALIQQSQLPQADPASQPNHQATTGSASQQAAQSSSAPTHQAPVPVIDPQAQLMVRQQLDVLANQGFIWQGEAWPGAEMECEVQRRQPGDDQDPAVDQEHWATRLTLQLPTLGEIQARLNLSGDQLVMRLVAPQSAERLSQSVEPLRSRLLAQGLQASQLAILAHEPGTTTSADTPDTEPDAVTTP
ncbi:flagellar hook-length control protein FliK [Castellaniella sp.]|uniref:flagellar hook-length control protein FliK n=1 Tax=Castellaniella sp. TaxID=1955812 RepID=UPI002AFEDD29|nr:flagellar hook-length control protein FliK [Castellaniella sp.]